MSRFDQLFAHKETLAFVPFFVLGYPNDEHCLAAIDAAIEEGADALELGIPFSDPTADGPIIQKASEAVLERDFSTDDAFRLIMQIREKHPSTPIGLLVYAQTVEFQTPDVFFDKAYKAGVDGVLIADVPLYESYPYKDSAKAQGVDLVYLAAPSSDQKTLEEITKHGASYTYVVSRKGVTGLDKQFSLDHLHTQISILNQLNAPAPILGFGIQSKEDIKMIKQSGARGFIIGSKLVSIISDMSNDDFKECHAIRTFIKTLK